MLLRISNEDVEIFTRKFSFRKKNLHHFHAKLVPKLLSARTQFILVFAKRLSEVINKWKSVFIFFCT